SGKTMCVLAVDSNNQATGNAGSPICWGYGINDGTSKPSNKQETIKCGSSSPTTSPTATSNTVIFESKKPVVVPSAQLTSLDGDDYVTGLGNDGRAYYWGVYGYATTQIPSDIKSCKVSSCSGKAASWVILAKTQTTSPNGGTNSSKTNGTGGSYSATQRGSSYSGVATPNNVHKPDATGTNYSGNNKSCASETHYGYTKKTSYDYTGQKVATTPPQWPGETGGVQAIAGNAFNGLACAKFSSAVKCDTHGTSAKEGQTGSGYNEVCTTKTTLFVFKTTSCDPTPTGPQQVASSMWTSGESIGELSVGKSGYVCAITDNTLGCWGANNKGQLGVGNTSNKNIPTKVNL
ncbi:MAG: RCC1 domain-containing protein, partial [Candidatus Saccharimonadales bacterium]